MPARTETTLAALRSRLTVDPGRPLLTFYDGDTGERVELSATTFDNWVTKIANLFSDELMLESGDLVRVDLPTHWLSAVALLGAWTAGLRISLHGPASHVAASVVGPDATTHPSEAFGQVVACSLRPLGGPFLDELPVGWLDFAREVPAQPDALVTPSLVGPQDGALEDEARQVSHGQLGALAHGTGTELGMLPGGRLVTDLNPSRMSGLSVGLVAPLVTGCSIVLLTRCDALARASIADQERATVAAWDEGRLC